MKMSPVLAALGFLLAGCASAPPRLPVATETVAPGTSVTQKGKPRPLIGTPVVVGEPLPATRLLDAATMGDVDLSAWRGQVLVLSIVPSIDTKVCEAQTHYLGEQGDRLPASVRRVVISRDTPFAQQRFSAEAKLTDLTYLSDYRDGSFGRSTGLLVDGLMLLARAVLVVDRDGVVRYLQVVPELTHLPDMEAAFVKATALAEGG